MEGKYSWGHDDFSLADWRFQRPGKSSRENHAALAYFVGHKEILFVISMNSTQFLSNHDEYLRGTSASEETDCPNCKSNRNN